MSAQTSALHYITLGAVASHLHIRAGVVRWTAVDPSPHSKLLLPTWCSHGRNLTLILKPPPVMEESAMMIEMQLCKPGVTCRLLNH